MKEIRNLDDLRNVVDKKTVDIIVTQYMMEAIAGGNVLRRFKDNIEHMDDNIKIDVKTIKGMIESCEEVEASAM
ncbi:MAG: hypothetical protein IJJ64_05155 [Butyrivibrio sp.]|nr:hypothetical protein [Butyrivibrio sp.]